MLLPWDECSWPSEENAPYRDLSLTLKKEHNISWILTKPEEGLQRGHFWQSKIFFSTLDYAKVPLSTSELMRQLLKTLLIEWEKVFNTAEWQLEQLVSHRNLQNTPSLTNHSVIAFTCASYEWKKPKFDQIPHLARPIMGSSKEDL